MSTIFEKNIQALMKTNPLLAAEIFGAKNENIEIVIQGEDNANLNLIDKKNYLPLYETTPIKEVSNTYEKFKEKYAKYPILFFFGIGNGILIKMLLNNPIRKKIIVIEPNIEILFTVLNLIDFSKEIEEQKLLLFLEKDFKYPDAINIISNLDIILFVKTYELHINTPYYEKIYKNDILKINEIFLRAIKQAIINFGNDTTDTLIGIEHSIKNFPEMLKRPYFKSLIGKKNSDVAIIVSTGPSLEKQLPLLKEIQDYVTIISVDASMPILEKWGIVPDFVTSLERVKETATLFKNTSKQFQEKFITLHASLQHEEVLKNSYGKNLLVMRSFAYNRFFNLPKYGYLGVGMSAANMAYELAYLLGFKDIILIGQDLAYSKEGKSHANGHPYMESYKENDIYIPAYGGKGTVRTSRVWNMFKNFFEKDIYETSQKGVKTYNATEGGARIEGAIEVPFKEITKKLVKPVKKKSIRLRNPSHNTYLKNLQKAYKKALRMIKIGENTQKKAEKLFLKVAKEFDELIRLNQNNELEKINFKYLEKLSKEIDKIKTLIEKEEFILTYGETITSYLINKETDLAKIQVKNPKTNIEKKAQLIDWIMNHKEWLFMLAGSINAQIIVVKRSLPVIEKELQKEGLI